MNDIEDIRFFLGDLKASNYNQSFIQDVENLIEENKELKAKQCVYKDTSSCNKTLSFETYTKLNDYIPKSKIKEIIYP